jgi:hypothetical protein
MPVAPLGFDFQRFSLSGSGPASRRNLPSLPFLVADILARQVSGSSAYDFEDLRIRRVRSERAGVTRRPQAVPLRAFDLYEVLPLVVSVCVATDLLSWASTQRWTDEPTIVVSALQSIKEPRDQLASFESC